MKHLNVWWSGGLPRHNAHHFYAAFITDPAERAALTSSQRAVGYVSRCAYHGEVYYTGWVPKDNAPMPCIPAALRRCAYCTFHAMHLIMDADALTEDQIVARVFAAIAEEL